MAISAALELVLYLAQFFLEGADEKRAAALVAKVGESKLPLLTDGVLDPDEIDLGVLYTLTEPQARSALVFLYLAFLFDGVVSESERSVIERMETIIGGRFGPPGKHLLLEAKAAALEVSNVEAQAKVEPLAVELAQSLEPEICRVVFVLVVAIGKLAGGNVLRAHVLIHAVGRAFGIDPDVIEAYAEKLDPDTLTRLQIHWARYTRKP